MSNLFDRLFDKATICESGCWEYIGNRDWYGYGRIGNGGQTLKTHRAAYDLVVGDIPEGLNVLHTCDNPPCVNPRHLFLGTQEDNVADMIAKGRRHDLKGTAVNTCKLSVDQVQDIRGLVDEGWSDGEIAEHFDIGKSAVRHIKSGSNWSWLPRQRGRPANE